MCLRRNNFFLITSTLKNANKLVDTVFFLYSLKSRVSTCRVWRTIVGVVWVMKKHYGFGESANYVRLHQHECGGYCISLLLLSEVCYWIVNFVNYDILEVYWSRNKPVNTELAITAPRRQKNKHYKLVRSCLDVQKSIGAMKGEWFIQVIAKMLICPCVTGRVGTCRS